MGTYGIIIGAPCWFPRRAQGILFWAKGFIFRTNGIFHRTIGVTINRALGFNLRTDGGYISWADGVVYRAKGVLFRALGDLAYGVIIIRAPGPKLWAQSRHSLHWAHGIYYRKDGRFFIKLWRVHTVIPTILGLP
jgi:hypothetical protein